MCNVPPPTTSRKLDRLVELARLRQQTRWDGYACLADYHQGAYECNWVSPYSKTAGNIDAAIFVMLQDWSSHDALAGPVDERRQRLGYTPDLPANLNLKRLLLDTFWLTLQDVFGTNLFPFIKPGNRSARLPMKDLRHAARKFGVPQVEIVQPVLVICMGLDTFNAVRDACGLLPCRKLADAIDSPFTHGKVRLWCQAHPGVLGQNNRGRSHVQRDWRSMSLDLQRFWHAIRDDEAAERDIAEIAKLSEQSGGHAGTWRFDREGAHDRRS